MAYYASGRVAACCTAKTSYSSCFYFYRDDKKNTPLCTIDDKFCGFSDAKDGSRFVLSKKGGIWSDGDGLLEESGPGAKGASALVTLKLSNELTLEFADRETCAVRCGLPIVRDFDVSLKVKRKGSYLDTATRGLKEPWIRRSIACLYLNE